MIVRQAGEEGGVRLGAGEQQPGGARTSLPLSHPARRNDDRLTAHGYSAYQVVRTVDLVSCLLVLMRYT